MESNLENSMIGSTENSVFLPSGKRQKTLSDTDGDQYDGASQQVVIYGNDKSVMGQDEQSESHFALEPSKQSKTPKRASGKKIGAFAVQCAKCQKWRLVSTKEKYEEIRERIREDPFVCEKAREWKPDVTCNDPSDVSQDGSKLWAIDKPDIAQAPQGWERLIKIRGEGSTKFADVYYRSPTGIQLRSTNEVEKYLAEHPEYVAQGVDLSHFSFKSPAPLQKDYVRKRSQTSQSGVTYTGSNKLLQPKEVVPGTFVFQLHPYGICNWFFIFSLGHLRHRLLQPCGHVFMSSLQPSVQPISWAAPLGNNKQLVIYNEDQPEAVQSEPLELTKPESPPAPAV